MLFMVFIPLSLNAETPDLSISGSMNNVSLAQYISYFEDNSCKKTFDEVRELDDSNFIPLTDKKVNIGYSSSIFWLKFNIKNIHESEITWIIESQYPLLDYISLYIPSVSGYNEIQSGDRLPFSAMPYGYYNFISKITTGPGSSTIYIRIKSEGSIFAKFRAWDEISFLHNMFYSVAMFWLFYGIMLALFLYNLFIFITTKDKTFLALSLFILTNLLFTFTHNGMARKYLWPDLTWWNNYSHPFFVLTSTIFIIWFTKRYLNTKINLPLTNRFLNIFISFTIPACLITFFLPYSIATRISVITAGVVASYLILFTMIPMFSVNKRLASYYLLSWFFFSLGAILLALRSYGAIHESFMAEWSFQIGFAAGIISLSIGVADKLNTLRRDKTLAIETLRESEERYRLFFETAHDAIVFYIDETPAYANRNMIKISGCREEEFYGSQLFDFFPENKAAGTDLRKIINDISSGRMNHARFEHVLKNKNGEELSVIVSLSSISAGMHKGILMIISDISSMKSASLKIQEQYSEIQEQLTRLESLNRELVSAKENLVIANRDIEKEKEYLSATLTSIGDGVISYDNEGKIFLMNKVAEDFTGLSSAEATGKNIRDILKPGDEESKELLFETLGTISEKYNFINIGVPFKLLDSEFNERIIELNSAVIKLHNEPLGIVLAMRDITVKTRIDNELIKMSKLESIGILAGGIAHDFNNLLTGISGNISILKITNNLNRELADSLGYVEKAVERATALTKQLLTFAKGGNPVMIPCRLEEIINESVKFIIKNADIKTVILADEDIPAIHADPNQISQAINNLLINAIQAMPDGGTITIEIKKNFTIPPEIPLKTGKFLLIRISDTGIGIPHKNLNKIFDPFFTTKSDGTGFGLTSTYSIIKKHKGYIRVDSRENIGTTFEIFMKTSDKKSVCMEDDMQPAKASAGGSVLIMDDEDYILEVLVKMLKYHGFAVSSAKTGEEAISLYKNRLEERNPYDYVILDLTVYNGLGGKETVEILKRIDPSVRAIVSSGYSDNPILSNYREYGFKGILSKPYIIEDVLRALKES